MAWTRLRAFLQFTRAHTASAEIGGFAIAAYLAGLRNLELLPFILYGILWHVTGFGENSLVDWIHGYDKADPSKAHHPLNTGVLRQATATDAILLLHIIGIVSFIGMMYFFHAPEGDLATAGITFVFAITAGTYYNFLGKNNKWAASLAISLSFMLVTMSMYFVAGGHLNIPSMLLFAFAFIYVYVQIALFGELKELEQMKEKNLLRHFGVYVNPDGTLGAYGNRIMLFVGPQYAARVLIFSIPALLVTWPWGVIPALLGIGMTSLYFGMIWQSKSRPQRLTLMGAGEALTYVFFVPCIIALSAWPYILLFILLPMGWFVLFNKTEWNSILMPRV